MKKEFFKKVVATVLVLGILLSVTQSAFAGTSSTPAGGYGTLTGSTSSPTPKVVSGFTQVSQNPDNAILTLSLEGQTINGSPAYSNSYTSNRGQTLLPINTGSLLQEIYKVFASHGVQGGSTNPPYAVYTVTTI